MTTSYPLSLRLKESGVPQEGGEYYWCVIKGNVVLLNATELSIAEANSAKFTILCRAFTIGELVRELPSGVSIDKLTTGFLAYTIVDGDIDINYQSSTPEEAAGELLAETFLLES